jgi:hypothetical protein
MIRTSDPAADVIRSGSYQLYCQVSVSRAGEIIATDVPVISGREEYDVELSVPERVVITVPRIDGDTDWTPRSADAPLAAYGQRIHVRLGVGIGTDGVEWMNRGEFLIHDTIVDEDTITVTAVGLLALVDEARLVAPYQPTGTLLSTIRGLVEPALTVVLAPSMTDRAVPAGMSFDEDRLGAVQEVLDAWPAFGQVTEDGYLLVRDLLDVEYGPSLLAYNREDQDLLVGWVQRSTGANTRENIVNAVVARGTAADGSPVQAAVYDTSGGPASYGGPFNGLPVPEFFFSPLLTTVAQCRAAARTILDRRTAPLARRFTLTCIPDPRLQGTDYVFYVPTRTGDSENANTVIDKLSLPYTAGDGAMELVLREVDW